MVYQVLALGSLLVFMGASPAQGLPPPGTDPIQKNLRPSELAALLAEPLAVDDFQNAMTLKEFLDKLTAYYRMAKGKEVLIQVDQTAFKEENPDAPDILDTQIKVPPLPRKRTGVQLFRYALRQIPTNNGAFVLRPGHLEITTYERTTVSALLSERIHVRFQRRPLHLALDDLFEETGVPIVLDQRVGNRARTLVNLQIANETSLGTVLSLMTEMINLKMIALDEVVIVTTPALAQQMLWERFFNTYRLPTWSRQ